VRSCRTLLPALAERTRCSLPSAKERFVAFRRSLPPTPPLERPTVPTRGLAFAVYSTPPVVPSDAVGSACAWTPTFRQSLSRLGREGYDWRNRLRALSVPTLVNHSEEDALPVAVSTGLAAPLPRAQRQLVPHSGQMPFWEAPDVFFTAVDSFLAAPQGAVRQSV